MDTTQLLQTEVPKEEKLKEAFGIVVKGRLGAEAAQYLNRVLADYCKFSGETWTTPQREAFISKYTDFLEKDAKEITTNIIEQVIQFWGKTFSSISPPPQFVESLKSLKGANGGKIDKSVEGLKDTIKELLGEQLEVIDKMLFENKDIQAVIPQLCQQLRNQAL